MFIVPMARKIGSLAKFGNPPSGRQPSEPRIDRLAFERQHREHAFMNPPQWLAGDEALQCLVTEGEFAQGQVALAAQAALAEPGEVLGGVIFRAIDDAEIFAAAHLERRLKEALA